MISEWACEFTIRDALLKMRAPKQPILHQDKLKVPEKYLRFATPGVVAVYRADKLKCARLVEIGAGIGGQTFAFAKVCKKVLAVESDKSSANILIQNLKKLKIENVEVLVADALSKNAIEKIKNFQPEIIFCDTERAEKGERTLESIKPSIKKLLETFSLITSKIAIEIPPFTKTENFDYNFEREFISLNNQLNRLTLYFNELKQSDISAISLPDREKIINQPKSKISKISNPEFLYVISPAIIVAGLLPELSSKFSASVLELNKPVLVSDKKINSNFLTGYKILTTCKNEQKEILQNLKNIGAERFRGGEDGAEQAGSRVGKIVLRYNIEPKDYWKVRNFYENQLSGNKEISLFTDDKNDKAILAEKF
ncbi:MAG: rRNA adenine N-6-methyltransferase family protein [Candidatus Nanoarchaeia archaeon]|nr:rRNA adenine N-6-methyltransferase family protein [Candidatus Nanoarchaeia archaeon]